MSGSPRSAPAPPPRKKKITPRTEERLYKAPSGMERNHSAGGRVHYDGDYYANMPPEREILNDTPETIIGPEVDIKGDMEFERLLRIEGRFEGQLITQGGHLIVGRKGELVGDVNNVACMFVDGKVVGNIIVEKLFLRENSIVHGDISCVSINVESNVVIVGHLNVHPQAPKCIDKNGKIVVPKKKEVVVPVEPVTATAKQNDAASVIQKNMKKKKNDIDESKEEEWGSTELNDKIVKNDEQLEDLSTALDRNIAKQKVKEEGKSRKRSDSQTGEDIINATANAAKKGAAVEKEKINKSKGNSPVNVPKDSVTKSMEESSAIAETPDGTVEKAPVNVEEVEKALEKTPFEAALEESEQAVNEAVAEVVAEPPAE